MTPARKHPLASLLACSCLALTAAGCGSSDEEPRGKPLPRATVSELEKRLDEIERRYEDGTVNFNAGACEDIQDDSFVAIDGILAGLPTNVDPAVRRAAKGSFDNLRSLTRDGCAEVEPPTETEPETETQPPPEATVPEVTVPDVTVPDVTVPDVTAPEDEPLPEGGGGAVPPRGGKGSPGSGGSVPGNGKGNGGGAQAPPGVDQE